MALEITSLQCSRMDVPHRRKPAEQKKTVELEDQLVLLFVSGVPVSIPENNTLEAGCLSLPGCGGRPMKLG